jgi:cytochrome P450
VSRYRPPAPPRQPDDQSALATLHHIRRCPVSALRQASYRMKMGRINLITRAVWIVNDLPLVREILTDQKDRFPKSVMMDHVLGLLVNHSSFISNGDVWRRRRRMMEMAFGQAGLKRVFPLMREAVQDMIDRFALETRRGIVSVEFEMAHVTADIIFRTVFSRPLARDEANVIYDAFGRFQKEMFRYGKSATMRLPKLFSFLTLRRAKKAAGEIRGHLDPLIKARMEAAARGEKGTEEDILATLLSVEDPVTATRFSYDELCEEVATLMLAGHETSSSTLAWALFLLAHAPDIQARAHDEVSSVLASRPAQFQDMKRLGLVRNIFREALRLYPPVPFMSRDIAAPEVMRGHTLATGTTIYLSPWILHRSEKNWSDPDNFDPDRFDRPETAESQRSAYIPFSMGPRVCLGAAFAMQESTLILAELIRRFRFDPVEGPDPVPRMRLSLRADREIRLRVSERPSLVAQTA